MNTAFALVGIVGVGAMGRGIAQIVAQAGREVRLFDQSPGAAAAGRGAVVAQWDRLQAKGRIDSAQAAAWSARLLVVDALEALGDCDLVIEAIVERLDAKQALFSRLEALLPDSSVLATNTSSLSVTAIAAGLRSPSRVAGLHFFNPVPLMKVAEVAQRLAAGQLGRKSGAGFYRYPDGAQQVPEEPLVPQAQDVPPVWVSPRAARRSELLQLLKDLGAHIETGPSLSLATLTLVAPLGFDITTVAVVERLDPARTVGIDLLIDDASTRRRVLATTPATRADIRDAAHALFARDGKPVSVIRDSGGFVTQRLLATIINIASDICQQRICSPTDLETAVTLGLGYPSGPLALGDRLEPTNVLEVLFNLQTVYGDPRCRPSPLAATARCARPEPAAGRRLTCAFRTSQQRPGEGRVMVLSRSPDRGDCHVAKADPRCGGRRCGGCRHRAGPGVRFGETEC